MRYLLLILLFAASLAIGLELTIDGTRSGPRLDGSQLYDIFYDVRGIAPTESLRTYIRVTTTGGETLRCVTLSGDWPWLVGPGQKRMVWDVGADEPGREWAGEGFTVKVSAGQVGYIYDPCWSVIHIAASESHSLACKEDGTIWAWGLNNKGQIGDGTTTRHYLPIQLDTRVLSSVSLVACRVWHSIALKNDGTVWSWGWNWCGQLGDSTMLDRHTPVQSGPGILMDITTIAGGFEFSLALKSDGSVWAWGGNDFGQIGDSTIINRLLPVQSGTGLLFEVSAISCGLYHSLALRSDSTVWAWGENGTGQLGDSSIVSHFYPVQSGAGLLTNIIAIASGYQHSLALRSDGTVWAWGDNSSGQIGDGTAAPRAFPVQSEFEILTNIVAITGGDQHSLALKSDGSVWAWGNNSTGQLGDGTTTDRYSPIQSGLGILTDVVAIAAGGGHSLALRTDGTIWAWGYNGSGQLGDGTTINRTVPVQVVFP